MWSQVRIYGPFYSSFECESSDRRYGAEIAIGYNMYVIWTGHLWVLVWPEWIDKRGGRGVCVSHVGNKDSTARCRVHPGTLIGTTRVKGVKVRV